MAYADLEFYKTSYLGNVIPDADFPRAAERASDFIDRITFERLMDGLPDDERQQNRIKKAVCAVAEKYYQLSLADAQATAAASGSTATTGATAGTTGVITSKSSGSESISFASQSEMGSGAKAWSAVYAAAGNEQEINKLLWSTAAPYLMGIRTEEGIPILYAGYKG